VARVLIGPIGHLGGTPARRRMSAPPEQTGRGMNDKTPRVATLTDPDDNDPRLYQLSLS
jgi:hypothetical protein